MHSMLVCSVLAGFTFSLATAQLIDLDAVDALHPKFVAAPIAVVEDVALHRSPFSNIPIPILPTRRHNTTVERRDGDSDGEAQLLGSGPTPVPDTDDAFLSYKLFQDLARGALKPDGYEIVFTNQEASLSASTYLGLSTLDKYDVLACASQCDQVSDCKAFNLYVERDPSLNPKAGAYANPPSTTNFRCTLWGAPVVAQEATNTGEYREEFHIVIAGSNAYNKLAPPIAVGGYGGPTELFGGAINAPLGSDGKSTYLGYQYFPFSQSQGYDPQNCADTCTIQTINNEQNKCESFNAFVISKNGIPQGLYCSLYNRIWTPNYAVNRGQYRGSDHFTVSRSYNYFAQ